MVSFTFVDESQFLNSMYPVNGQRSVEYQVSVTTTTRNKAFVIITSIMSILFLVLAVLMFILYKKDGANDQAEETLRQSIVDLDVDVFDKEGRN